MGCILYKDEVLTQEEYNETLRDELRSRGEMEDSSLYAVDVLMKRFKNKRSMESTINTSIDTFVEILSRLKTNPSLTTGVDVNDITYTNEEGEICARCGLRSNKFTEGGSWEVIKEFKGASHERGGIDIEIGNGFIRMSGKQGIFEAKDGVVIAADGFVMDNDNPPDKPPFDEWYKTVPIEKNDTSNYNLRRAYELAPRKDLEEFVSNPDAHLYSSYENKETGKYEFMKSKNHETINLELDWYNSKAGADFKKKYDLVDDGSDYYQYVPKNKTKK